MAHLKKDCQWPDSNSAPLMSEVNTVPQPTSRYWLQQLFSVTQVSHNYCFLITGGFEPSSSSVESDHCATTNFEVPIYSGASKPQFML